MSKQHSSRKPTKQHFRETAYYQQKMQTIAEIKQKQELGQSIKPNYVSK